MDLRAGFLFVSRKDLTQFDLKAFDFKKAFDTVELWSKRNS